METWEACDKIAIGALNAKPRMRRARLANSRLKR